MSKLVVGALFDDGNQSVLNSLKGDERFDVISIGIQKKPSVFYCDLSAIDCCKQLKKLPKADIIVASPPCESWSIASSMSGGNACGINDTNANIGNSDDYLRIREFKQYINHPCHYKFNNCLHKRILGELTAYHTIEIIREFSPKYYYIENPQSSMIGIYLKKYCGFGDGCENICHYQCYGEYSKKPTIFLSNYFLNLKTSTEKTKLVIRTNTKNKEYKSMRINLYDDRSEIPPQLIKNIFNIFYGYEIQTRDISLIGKIYERR